MILSSNKKVLLRERKRHTARCVVSTPSVVLPGYPPHPDLAGGGGYLTRVPPRVPPWPGYPPPARIPPQPGYPPRLDLAGYPPTAPWHSGEMLQSIMGYGYPPSCPMAFWEMLQSIMGYGYPPGCEQTNKVKLLPSRRTTYAGGNNYTN